MPSYTKVAGGDIHPSRFVSLDTTTDGQVLEASAGGKLYGVSQPGTRAAPYPGLDDALAAKATENLMIYGPPEKDVFLEIGTGGCVPGDRIKATTNGVGIVTTTNLDEYGAIAQSTAISGKLALVQLVPPTQVSTT